MVLDTRISRLPLKIYHHRSPNTFVVLGHALRSVVVLMVLLWASRGTGKSVFSWDHCLIILAMVRNLRKKHSLDLTFDVLDSRYKGINQHLSYPKAGPFASHTSYEGILSLPYN